MSYSIIVKADSMDLHVDKHQCYMKIFVFKYDYFNSLRHYYTVRGFMIGQLLTLRN